MIYFDNAATTPVLPCAWDAMQSAPEGNPSSIHAAGREAKAALENVRATIAQFLNCAPCEVYFTSGATESCNWMVKCLRLETDAINYNGTVHHAVSEAARSYLVPIATHGKPSAILSLVNNETGQICDVDAFCRKKRPHRIALDATAAVAHIPIDFHALGADYMAFGGHKFGSLKGIGALIVKEGCPIAPMIFGGAQERGMRGGTVSVPLVSSMAAALTWRSLHMAENEKAIRAVAQELIISLGCHRVDFDINLPDGKSSKDCAPHILSIRFPGVYGASLAAALSDHGVMVSTGSACSSGDNAASANLMASGLTEQQALETIRFSFDWYNTTAEASEAAGIIADIVPTLRRG
jgi:cysteine desulfurase|nr:MAG TPA: cysteine sulfinate desulfinase/cysteine desulfurase [Caudoviricetes sp.]